MPVVAAIASSHAPAMFEPVDMWPAIYAAIPEETKQSQPASAREETEEVLRGYERRISAAFTTLTSVIRDARADVLVVIGDDQGDVFDTDNMPTLAVFTGESVWALTGTAYRRLDERERVDLPCHSEVAKALHKGLLRRGFAPSEMKRFEPRGNPDGGISHMVAQPVPRLVPDRDVPIVPVLVNEYFPPMLDGRHCHELGVAVAETLSLRPERIVLYASGGLSHDPVGPRAGWIDEPLDRWVLERLERNDHAALRTLFTFDSATLHGGTGEIRAWITVAAALDRPATVVDYIPVHHAKTGLAFAYWPPLPQGKTA